MNRGRTCTELAFPLLQLFSQVRHKKHSPHFQRSHMLTPQSRFIHGRTTGSSTCKKNLRCLECVRQNPNQQGYFQLDARNAAGILSSDRHLELRKQH